MGIVAAHRVRARVLRDARPVRGATVEMENRDGGRLEFIETVVSGQDGIARFDGVVSWKSGRGFEFRVLAPDGWVAVRKWEGGLSPVTDVDLDLVSPRELEVQVIDADAKTPIPGAVVRVHTDENGIIGDALTLVPVQPSGADGKTWIKGLMPGKRLRVDAEAPGWTGGWSVEVGAGQAQVTISLRRATGWKLFTKEEVDVAEGTEITVRITDRYSNDAPVRGVIRKGELWIPECGPWQSAIATVPDGAFAVLWNDRGDRTARFSRPRTARIEVRWDDGTPASGLASGLAVSVPEGTRPGETSHRAVTDEMGRATLTVLSRDETMAQWRWGDHHLYLGELDLREGDASLVATIKRPVAVTFRVTLDGACKLPADLQILPSDGHLADLTEDPANGTMSFRYLPDEPRPQRFSIEGAGFSSVVLKLPYTEPNGKVAMDLPLRTR
jgi:hypothetical protein